MSNPLASREEASKWVVTTMYDELGGPAAVLVAYASGRLFDREAINYEAAAAVTENWDEPLRISEARMIIKAAIGDTDE